MWGSFSALSQISLQKIKEQASQIAKEVLTEEIREGEEFDEEEDENGSLPSESSESKREEEKQEDYQDKLQHQHQPSSQHQYHREHRFLNHQNHQAHVHEYVESNQIQSTSSSILEEEKDYSKLKAVEVQAEADAEAKTEVETHAGRENHRQRRNSLCRQSDDTSQQSEGAEPHLESIVASPSTSSPETNSASFHSASLLIGDPHNSAMSDRSPIFNQFSPSNLSRTDPLPSSSSSPTTQASSHFFSSSSSKSALSVISLTPSTAPITTSTSAASSTLTSSGVTPLSSPILHPSFAVPLPPSPSSASAFLPSSVVSPIQRSTSHFVQSKTKLKPQSHARSHSHSTLTPISTLSPASQTTLSSATPSMTSPSHHSFSASNSVVLSSDEFSFLQHKILCLEKEIHEERSKNASFSGSSSSDENLISMKNEYEKEIENLRKELMKSKLTPMSLSAAIPAVPPAAAVSESSQEIDRLRRDLKTANMLKEKLISWKEHVQNAVTRLKKDFQDKETNYNNILTNERKAFEEIQKVSDEEMQQLMEKNKIMEANLNQLAEKLTNANSKSSYLEERFSELQKECRNLMQENERLRLEMERNQQQQLERQQQQEIEQANSSLSQHVKSSDEKEEKISQLTFDLDFVKRQNEDYQQLLKDEQAKSETLGYRFEDSKIANESLKKQISELQLEAQTMEHLALDFSSSQDELRQKREVSKQQEYEIGRLKKKQQELEDEITTIQDRFATLSTERDEALQAVSSLPRLEQELSHSHSVIVALREQNILLQQQLKTTSEEKDKLKKGLDDTMKKVAAFSDDTSHQIDRRLVVKMLVTYFERKEKDDVFDLMCKILHFSDEDKRRVAAHRTPSGSPLAQLASFFSPFDSTERSQMSELQGSQTETSIADLWVDFLVKEADKSHEATNQPALKRVPATYPSLSSPSQRAVSHASLHTRGVATPMPASTSNTKPISHASKSLRASSSTPPPTSSLRSNNPPPRLMNPPRMTNPPSRLVQTTGMKPPPPYRGSVAHSPSLRSVSPSPHPLNPATHTHSVSRSATSTPEPNTHRTTI